MSGSQLVIAMSRIWLCCHIHNLYRNVCSVNTTYFKPSDLRLMKYSVGNLQTRLSDQDIASFITVFTTAHHLSLSWATWLIYVCMNRLTPGLAHFVQICTLQFCMYSSSFPSLLHALPISLLLNHPDKIWSARKADNLTAVCESTV
jgi:hypothetical protein